MRISLIRLQGFLLRMSIPFWLLGLIVPHIYLLFTTILLKVKKSFIQSQLFLYITIFLFIQIVSLTISVFYPFFTWSRFLASFHNIIVYLFLFAGINFALTFKQTEISKLVGVVLKTMLWIIVIFSIISFLTNVSFSYPGILALINKNKYTIVSINSFNWHIIQNFPRANVYGIYATSTGLVLIILYPLYKISKSGFGLHDILFVFGSFMTGSRMFLAASFVLLFFSFIKSKKSYLVVFFLLPILILIAIPYLDYLYHLRERSNVQRFIIYESSFKLMMDTNPIFGVGIKPYIKELTGGGDFPLGSHSSLMGYFFKTGLLGGVYILLGYLFVFSRYLLINIKLAFLGRKFERTTFFLESSFIVILMSSLLTDFDSFEPVMLFFGILIGTILCKK